ncbi:MAG: PEP/pyruvate-binding domain-containing protein, partial [Pseudorhodoplanes sp.]
MIVPLSQATDAAAFGGKAQQLGRALNAQLPVPPGFAVSVDGVAAAMTADPEIVAQIADAVASIDGPFAARSSAVGEDAADASFAGQHVTVLNLHSADAALDGLRAVYHSAHDPAALAYRAKKGISGPVRIAAVLQKLVVPTCAGVLFTRHPVTGADEFVIEAAWGLGEAVVQGMVTPDHIRLARDGRILEQRTGDKPIAIRCNAQGGTEEIEVEPHLVEAPCLEEADLARLVHLAQRCESEFG